MGDYNKITTHLGPSFSKSPIGLCEYAALKKTSKELGYVFWRFLSMLIGKGLENYPDIKQVYEKHLQLLQEEEAATKD